jgi:hypothetical protein
MKKILLFITTMLIAGGVQAQSYDKLKSMLLSITNKSRKLLFRSLWKLSAKELFQNACHSRR